MQISKRRAALVLVPPALLLSSALWSWRARAQTPKVETVGPSVLLNARDAGQVTVLDLRPSGRAVPGATKSYRPNGAPLFLLGEETAARLWAKKHRISAAFIVPPQMIEYEKLRGTPQIEPRAAQAKVEREGWRLFDISEAFEFQASRLPQSERFDYAGFRAGNWAQLPKDQPFIVACRVGHRSQLVVQKLRAAGYDARNLDGGLWGWECEGLGVER